MLIMAGVAWGVPIFGRVPFGMSEVQQDIIGNFVTLCVFNMCLSPATSAPLRVT